MNKEVNEVPIWKFREQDQQALKEIIEAKGYDHSERQVENIYTLARIFGDEKIYEVMNELRIEDSDRLVFEKLLRGVDLLCSRKPIWDLLPDGYG